MVVVVINGDVVGLATLPASSWLRYVFVLLMRLALGFLNIYLIIKLVSERIIYERVRQPGAPARACRWYMQSFSASTSFRARLLLS